MSVTLSTNLSFACTLTCTFAHSFIYSRSHSLFRVHLSLRFKARLSAKSLLWKSVFIHIEITTNYHNKNFALRVALKDRLRETRKWPIETIIFSLWKEKRIYDLKKKNQELEKFKFVLDYKIKELKKQIEPRENDIKAMKEQIQEVNDLFLFFYFVTICEEKNSCLFFRMVTPMACSLAWKIQVWTNAFKICLKTCILCSLSHFNICLTYFLPFIDILSPLNSCQNFDQAQTNE